MWSRRLLRGGWRAWSRLLLRAGLAVLAWTALGVVSDGAPAWADVETSVPPPGLREHTPAVHALTNARIVLGPGRVIPRGTLVIRDGVITDVGAKAVPPPDAVVWNLAGATLYAGFIDAGLELGGGGGGAGAGAGTGAEAGGGSGYGGGKGAPYWNRWVTPQFRVDREYAPDTAAVRKWRSQGFTTALVIPKTGVVKGTSAVVELGDGDPSKLIVKPSAALHVTFVPPTANQESNEYPTSPMGALTLVRQALYDADWYAQAQAAWTKDASLPRPEANEALAALEGYANGSKPVVVDTDNELDAIRADRFAREFRLNLILRGSGREYRRLDAMRAAKRPVILPVNFPSAPPVRSPEEAVSVSLEDLMHWDLAPENPGRLARAGVPIAFTTEKLPDSVSFLAALRKAVQRGLDKDDALRALTMTPASIFGLDTRMGTLDRGRIANIVVADGDLFRAKTKIREVWIDGRRFEVIPRPAAEPRGDWRVEVGPNPAALGMDRLELKIEGEPGEYSGSIRTRTTAKLTSVSMLGARLAFAFPGDSLGLRGIARFSATVADSEMLGTGIWPDGGEFSWRARKTKSYVPPPDTTSRDSTEMASFAVNYPLGEFGRKAPPERPAAVFFHDATVWTSGPAGTIEDGDVLVQAGRIKATGKGLKAPAGARVIECAGRHLTPGIIDPHSHIATDGWVNESGQTVTAEVRIGDFVDPNDIDIYRQLAGGVTAVQVLHGSANTIGGQNQAIKLRWGAEPDAMKFEGAIPTIKFALGENVKQSNWGDKFTTRYPQTRMGVEQLLRDEFRAARDYEEAWRQWQRTKRGIRPRRDLELDAIVEVLHGTRRIQCHAYRQDEILMLMKVCDDFGIKNVTFHHVLEGYKVADEMAKRGFGGSTFTDWWAYKIEVYDAIPQNGALMYENGVLVSYNSDNNELARRLNAEAGKGRKYGKLPEAEALKFVTLNPARQMGVDRQVGSIEIGKDADLALWSGPPLSTLSRCEQTWIEGRRYFDRDEDHAARVEALRMRAVLVQKVLRAEKTR